MKRILMILFSIITFLTTIILIIKDDVKNSLLFKLNSIYAKNLNVYLKFDILNQTYFKNLVLKNVNINLLDVDKNILLSLKNDKIKLKNGYQNISFKFNINNFVIPKDFFIAINFKLFNLINMNIVYSKNELINE